MSPPSAFLALSCSVVFFAVAACGDSGDDDCPACQPGMGGSLPPSVPTTQPDPNGGDTSSGGVSGTPTGGLGGTDTGGMGGTLTGGSSPDGGTGAFGDTGGTLTTGGALGTGGTGAVGNTGGTLATGGTLNGGVSGGF